MSPRRNMVLITFRCIRCNTMGGGCKTVDYTETLITVMAPIGWHEHIDATPGDTRMVSFVCSKCHAKEGTT